MMICHSNHHFWWVYIYIYKWIYIYIHILVGGFNPLKNMKVSCDYCSQIYGKTICEPWCWNTYRSIKPLPPLTILILVMILFLNLSKNPKNTKYEDQNFPQIEGDDFSFYAA